MSPRDWLGRPACVLAVVAVMITGCQSLDTLTSKSEGISQKRKQRNLAAAQRFDQKRDRAELEAAQARCREGDLDGCTETLERLLARNPENLQARLLMAEALLADNRPQEAVRYLEPALAGRAHDARVHHLMGMLLDATGQRADALVFYEQAARLQPQNEVYQVSYEALAASDEPAPRPGEFAQALPLQTPVPLPVEPEPSSPESFPGVTEETPGPQAGELFISDLGPSEEVIAADPVGRSALSRDVAPRSAPELVSQGRAALAQGAVALAFAYFREAMAIDPHDPQIPTSAAVSALRHNQPDLAVSLLEPLLEAFPDSPAIRRILGAAHYRLGDYQSSQVVLQQALSLDNSNALSYFLMGCTLVKLGQPAVAATYFRQARRLDPRYPSDR